MNDEKIIYVFADFGNYKEELVGRLYVTQSRGRESYAFEYEDSWLKNADFELDPDLALHYGRQYPGMSRDMFGIFSDSAPDRWGRRLMMRREEIRARNAGEKPRKLSESDFLLGVYDPARMGGLRFKTNLNEGFVSDDNKLSTPPWARLRELEHASKAYEEDDYLENDKWLNQLIAPGSSLGGARPKANVEATDGSLWIAKFPSKHDDTDVGAWEMVVHQLAELCELDVPEAKTEKFSPFGTTFLVKRFDRDKARRVHFSSAMTMLGKKDGDGAEDGSGYLDIVSFLKAKGACPRKDTAELWRRIVFSMAVSNTDDHFRNHGFILSSQGWRLSPMYDVNPDIYGGYLSLTIDGISSNIDYEIAIDAAEKFGLKKDDARRQTEEIKDIVKSNWMRIAERQHIKPSEIKRMLPAFSDK